VTTQKSGGVGLMGGGTDVDNAFKWMIKRSGGGNFLVLRASGTNAYNPYIYQMGGIQSVATMLVNKTIGANDPFVNKVIQGAEAIFFAGGDQWMYYSLWGSTLLQSNVQKLINNSVVIAGTSAGMEILGNYLYTAQLGSVTSSEALRNPYDQYITFGQALFQIPNIEHIITDMHFYQRDRMGRLVTFLARLMISTPNNESGDANVRGIACDEATALIVDQNGIGQVVSQSNSNNFAYFLTPSTPPSVCKTGVPLSFSDIRVERLSVGGSFDIKTWKVINNNLSYTLNVNNGNLTSTQTSIDLTTIFNNHSFFGLTTC